MNLRPFFLGTFACCSLGLVAQTDDNFQMNMSVGSGGEQMNMNISIQGAGEQMNLQMDMEAPDGWTDEPAAPQGQPAVATPAAAPMASAPLPMDDFEFQRYLNAIKAKDFEDSKHATAKAPLRGQYLTAEQIALVMRAFDFESTRVEFAILAHSRCVDPDNYYLTYDAFDFELSIEELEEALGE